MSTHNGQNRNVTEPSSAARGEESGTEEQEDDEIDLEQEFEVLAKVARANKLDRVVSCCDKILRFAPDDQCAKRTKCVALAKKGRFEEAKMIALEIGAKAEAAYCAYRMGEPGEALQILGDDSQLLQDDTLGCRVAAQAHYKLGEYAVATRYYSSLVESGKPSVVSNYLAACALSKEEVDDRLIEKARTCDACKHYELVFNAACALLERGRATEANELLERIEAADAKFSPTDACLVATQLAASELAIGNKEQAAERCKKVLSSLYPSAGDGRKKAALSAAQRNVACCAAHALYAAREGDEIFDSHKRLRPFAGDVVDRRRRQQQQGNSAEVAPLLTWRQRVIAAINWARLLLDMGKVNEAREAVESLLSDEGGAKGTARADATLLAALCSLKKRQAAKSDNPATGLLAALREECTARPPLDTEEAVALSRARAQCLVDAGDLTAAAKELETHRENALERARLLEAAGNIDAALSALREYDGNATELALYYLRLGDVQTAADNLPDAASKALALSWFDADAADRIALECGLDEDDDDEDIDPEALLDEPLPRSQQSSALLAAANDRKGGDSAETTTAPRRRSAASTQRRRAKLRAAHLKRLEERGDYDPKHPAAPDPERWLPKKLRSYSKRGRKNQRGKFSGAQGVDANFSKDVAKLDVAARAKQKGENDALAASNGHGKKLPRGKKGRR